MRPPGRWRVAAAGGAADPDVDPADVADVADVAAVVGRVLGVEVRAWRDLGGGFTTNLAMSTDGGTVVARVHRASTGVDRVVAEQEARRALAAAGVPAVVPRALTSLPDGRHVEVEPYVDARDRMRTAPRLATGFTLLARVHDVLRTASLPAAARSVAYSHHVAAADAEAVAAAALDAVRAGPAEDLTAVALDLAEHVRAVAALEATSLDHQVVHLTHGDFWDDNVLLRGEEVAAVLDLGFMAVRARVDDLALPFWFWLLEPGRGLPAAADMALLARLADAYDRGARRPLSAQERSALPLAVARQPAWAAQAWSLDPDRDRVAAHVRRAAAQLPVARAVLARLPAWQEALTAVRP